MPRTASLLAVFLSSATLYAQQPTVNANINAFAPHGTRAVVLFFVASDCPISNRSFPEMKRLRETFTPRHIEFRFVYPNATEKPAEIAAHQHAFDPAGQAIADPESALVNLAHAEVTPEVAILVPTAAQTWIPAYVGRIDDRFVHIGQERPAATRHFAETALNNLLAGSPITPDTGTPVGCTIVKKSTHP